MSIDPPFPNPELAQAFAAFPTSERTSLLELRRLIFDTAAQEDKVDPLSETLKWGQPAYVTARKTGTTLRLGLPKTGGFGIYVHCQSKVIPQFQAEFPTGFAFDGTRAIVFETGQAVPHLPIAHFIRLALTYHLRPPRKA